MTFPVVWLMPDVPRQDGTSPHRLTWAGAQVEGILGRAGGEHLVNFEALTDETTATVVVVPAEYYVDRPEWLRNHLNNYDGVVVLLVSDEASQFPHWKLNHQGNMRLWIQTPRPGRHAGTKFLGFGLPPNTTRFLGELSRPSQSRPADWFFSGQANHARRHQCIETLERLPNGELLSTPGFSQGHERSDYLARMARAKVIPCPSGPATPDTFRAWEALEAGCIPVVDGVCPGYPGRGYWRLILGQEPPFPVVEHWGQFPGVLESLLVSWPANANRLSAWWAQYQRQLAKRIEADITEVMGPREVDEARPTVLVSTSSIPAHPDYTMIDETIASVRHHLPQAEILVMCDGIRPEQEHRRADYETYLQALTWLCRHRWAPATPIIADDFQHQANMTRRALAMVDTPLVLFIEHDTPLVTDEPIDWAACATPILADELDVIRFHYEAVIPEPHQYLMLDSEPAKIGGCPVIRTRQFSQRPHLASTQWYRQVIAEHFPETARTFIEDKLHSVCQSERWGRNRLAIYAPGPNVKRSLNLDGRKDDRKADCVFA